MARTATDVKTTSAQRRSRANQCEVTPIQKMTRKATEEQKAAEFKTRCRVSRNRLRYSNQVQQYQAAEEARTTAAKEAVEAKGCISGIWDKPRRRLPRERLKVDNKQGRRLQPSPPQRQNVSRRTVNEQLVIKRQLKRFRIYHR